MKNLKLKISIDLLERILKGDLKKLEDIIINDANKHALPETEGNRENKKKLIELLYSEREKTIQRKNKLAHPQTFNHFGDYVKNYLEDTQLSSFQFALTFKFDITDIDKIIKNTTDLTSFAPDKIAKLIKGIRLNLNDAKILISKSIDLLTFKPTFKKVFARYNPKEGQELKDRSMDDGLNELLLKANKRKTFTIINKNTSRDKDVFLKELEHYYLN